MPKWIAWADLVVCAGGSTCWEVAFLGLPGIVLVLADNQRRLADAMAELGSVVHLGEVAKVSPEQIADALSRLAADDHLRRRLSRRGRCLVDGRGAARTVQALLHYEQLGQGSPPKLRRAEPEDAYSLWQLANDPLTRLNSFHGQPIRWCDHLDWYEGKLASPHCRMWVFESSCALAGQIRYDCTDAHTAEIGFSVGPRFRGRGLGQELLSSTWLLAGKELKVQRLRGIVFEDNQPSQKAFLRAGFRFLGKEVCQGRACHVFERRLCAEE